MWSGFGNPLLSAATTIVVPLRDNRNHHDPNRMIVPYHGPLERSLLFTEKEAEEMLHLSKPYETNVAVLLDATGYHNFNLLPK
jgi:hypothetical protein